MNASTGTHSAATMIALKAHRAWLKSAYERALGERNSEAMFYFSEAHDAVDADIDLREAERRFRSLVGGAE